MSFIVLKIFFILKSILFDMSISYCSFLLIPIFMKYFLPSSHFQFVCVPRSEVGLLKTAYIWVLFLYPFCQSMSFGWGFSPFTFKVIIDMYVFIAIFLIALDLFLLLFFSFLLLFFFSAYRSSFSICCKAGLVLLNSLSFC